MEKIDLFDIQNIEDVPVSIQKELKARRKSSMETKIMELFNIAQRQLTIDEIVVALYRKFNVEKSARQVFNALYKMINEKNPQVECVKKGIYQLKRKEENALQNNINLK